MNTEDIKKMILEEARRNSIELTEDELNAKMLEASKMDPDKLERLNGGGELFNCDQSLLCAKNYLCAFAWNRTL